MKLFIFFSLVFLLVPFTFGQEQKHEELHVLIDEAIKQNPNIAAVQSQIEMMQERIPQASRQDIFKTSVEPSKVYSDESILRLIIIRRGLSKPDGINNIVPFRQAQYDFNLLVTL
jgi:hypothetical protein